MIIIENDCRGYLPGGFFSKFLIVLDWIHNSIYNEENIYVDWSCMNTLDHNLWDLFFEQPNMEFVDNKDIKKLFHYRFYHNNYVYSDVDTIMPYYKNHNGHFWSKPEIFKEEYFQNIRNEYNKAYQKIQIKQTINDNVSKYLSKFGKKNLGVTVRIPLHYTYNMPEGEPISNRISPEEYYKTILNEIDEEFKRDNYDKIFVACDVKYFIDLMVSKFGEEKILFTDYKRVESLNSDWVAKKLTLKEEYFLILTDSLLLSKCDYIMGGSSNIFIGTLFINNSVDFKVFDTLKTVYGC